MNRRSFLVALAAGPALLAILSAPKHRCHWCGRDFDPKNPAYEPELTICSDCFETERKQYFSNVRLLRSRKLPPGQEIYIHKDVLARLMRGVHADDYIVFANGEG